MSQMVNTTDVPEIGEVEAAKAVDASPKKETALGKRSANVDNSNSPAAPARKTRKSTSKNSETAEEEQEQVAPKITKDKEADEPSKNTETDSQGVAPAQGAAGDGEKQGTQDSNEADEEQPDEKNKSAVGADSQEADSEKQ